MNFPAVRWWAARMNRCSNARQKPWPGRKRISLLPMIMLRLQTAQALYTTRQPLVKTMPVYAAANHLPFIQLVNTKGEMCGGTPWDGLFVKEADPKIIEALEKEGKLFDAPEFEHSYPFCWRCDTPLVILCAQHLVYQNDRACAIIL